MRFRNFSKNCTINSSEYSRKKAGLNMIKTARLNNALELSKDKNNYVINFNNSEIVWYTSYELFMSFVRSFYIIQPDCENIQSGPMTLDNALTSEIGYNDMFSYVKDKFYESHCTKYDKLLKVSICKEKKNTLYSYGVYFNNTGDNKVYNFPVKVNLSNCGDKHELYDWLNHCEEKINTTCCKSNNAIKEHQHMFPSQYRNFYYKHNHETKPHNKDGKYIFKNYEHGLPFSIFPRHTKDRVCKFVKPNGNISYKTTKGKNVEI